MNSDSTHYKQKLQSLIINEIPFIKLQFIWISDSTSYAYRLLVQFTVTLSNNFYWNKKHFIDAVYQDSLE